MSNDLVSIIMPSYNCGRFVRETIESVLTQTYSNWELLFVDDCSIDDTQAIVHSFEDSRIHYFRNETNSGAAVSRNRGLREAKGHWIAFLDSDDLWEPEKLELQIRFMEENGYCFSYTEYQEIDENGNPFGIRVLGPKHISWIGMFSYCWPGCLTVMYDVSRVGLVQIVDIKKNNDYAIWLKVCRKADCHLLEEKLASYRKREGSISHHGHLALIKWHYKMFREAENLCVLASIFLTGINLLCGVYKKVFFVRHVS